MVGLSAIAALGSAAVGAIGSAIQNRKARNILAQQKDDNRNWYNTRMSEDYTSRVDSQAVVQRQRELLSEQARNARATNAVAGGSPETEAIAKAQATSSLAQTMSDISAQGAAYKDKVEQEYRAQDAAIRQQQGQIAHNQAVATAQAASQAVNAGINMVGNEAYLGQQRPSAGDLKFAANRNAENTAAGLKEIGQASVQQSQKNLDATIRNSIFKGIK